MQRLRKQLNISNDTLDAHRKELPATALVNSTHLWPTDMRELTERLSHSHELPPNIKIRRTPGNKITQDTRADEALNNFRGDPGTVLSQKSSDTKERKHKNKKIRKDGEF